MHRSEQELIRRENLQKIIELGINPYPSEEYHINLDVPTLRKEYVDGVDKFKDISIVGRLMGKRIMGKASFAELQTAEGRIQLYISRDDICPGENKDMYNNLFKKYLDIGDFIGIKGYAFLTHVGELSIHVTELNLLSKSLRPLPIVKRDDEGHTFDAFTDPEQRYRMRYVDLVVNPDVKETFVKRTKMYNTMK